MNADLDHGILSLASDGVLLSSDVTKAGIHRSAITKLVSEGILIQNARGIYILSDDFDDEYFLLQNRYKKGIYSHATALYLHGYSDRVPLRIHMTFPIGYNCRSLQKENIDITRVNKANYELGIISVKTPYGGDVRAYDLERCLCDVLRGQGDDIQIVQSAF